MALISTKGMYGLSALYEIYRVNSLKPMQAKEIAENANIPLSYLEQILVVLKKAKFVKSVRGAYGGYMLAKDASAIKLIDIFSALEKDISIIDTKAKNTVLDKFYEDATKQLENILDISLSDLHRKYKEKRSISYTTFGL